MKITFVTTGGTIAKTFDERQGSLLSTHRPVVESIVAALRLPDVQVVFNHILFKDSLELTDADRQLILETVRNALPDSDAVLIAHGTDTLDHTGEILYGHLEDLEIPVILTGAMRPYEFRDSDALQNVTEALLACRFCGPGVYVAMHNRVLQFPGVVKDRQQMSFVRKDL